MNKIIIASLSIFCLIWFTFADSQLDKAITWMNLNWLTKFHNSADFMANNSLRRDEATKFFVQYATQILWLTPDTSNTSCNFRDLNQARPDLKDTIKEACQLWLFWGANGKFMPTQSLTNAQAITVLIRMIDWKKDESQGHFAQKYFETAESLGIMSWLVLDSTTNFDKLTTRWEVSVLLYNTSNLNYSTNNTTSNNTSNTTPTKWTNIKLNNTFTLGNIEYQILGIKLFDKIYNSYSWQYPQNGKRLIIEYSYKNIDDENWYPAEFKLQNWETLYDESIPASVYAYPQMGYSPRIEGLLKGAKTTSYVWFDVDYDKIQGWYLLMSPWMNDNWNTALQIPITNLK